MKTFTDILNVTYNGKTGCVVAINNILFKGEVYFDSIINEIRICQNDNVDNKFYFKIILQSSSLDIPGIPKFRVEEDVEALAEKFMLKEFGLIRYTHNSPAESQCKRWFKEIYQAAKAKRFDMEQVVKAIDMARIMSERNVYPYSTTDIINSLTSVIDRIEVEIDYETEMRLGQESSKEVFATETIGGDTFVKAKIFYKQ